MTTYLVYGFPRGDEAGAASKNTVIMLVDADERDVLLHPGQIAEKIAGGYRFPADLSLDDRRIRSVRRIALKIVGSPAGTKTTPPYCLRRSPPF